MEFCGRGPRITAVDGLRGLLATVVLIDHAALECGYQEMGPLADMSVAVFFALSGYVLTRGWDGAFGRFLLRRFTRLWPVFALALSAGYVLAWKAPEPLEYVWIPLPRFDANEICPPSWSLFIEAWAALAMPAIAWSARGSRARALACIGGLAGLDYLWVPQSRALRALACYLVCFLIGAALSGRILRSAVLGHRTLQWMGRISYSLYLTHWLVFRAAVELAGARGLLAGVPLAFGVAWLVYRWVEMPSVELSRKQSFFAKKDQKTLVHQDRYSSTEGLTPTWPVAVGREVPAPATAPGRSLPPR